VGRPDQRVPAAQNLESIRSHPPVLDFIGQVLRKHIRVVDGVHSKDESSRHVDVAGDARKKAHGPDRLQTIRGVLEAYPPLERGRLGLRKHPCGYLDFLCRDPCDLLCPFRGMIGNARGELVEADGPLLDELLVVEPLADDDVHDAQCEGIIRARPDLKPDVRFLCQIRLSRVDDDQLRSLLYAFLYGELDFSVRSRFGGVVPPDEYAGRVHIPVVITDGQVAIGHHTCEDPRQKALSRARLTPVRGPEGIGEPEDMHEMVSSRTHAYAHGLDSMALFDLVYLPDNGVEGLVP